MSETTPESFTDEDTPDSIAATEQGDGNAIDPDRDPVSDALSPDIPDEELPEDLQPTEDNPLASGGSEDLADDPDNLAQAEQLEAGLDPEDLA